MDQYQNITNIPIATRRILTTQWVGQAWEEIKNEKKNIIAHFFEKTGCAITIDGFNMESIFLLI